MKNLTSEKAKKITHWTANKIEMIIYIAIVVSVIVISVIVISAIVLGYKSIIINGLSVMPFIAIIMAFLVKSIATLVSKKIYEKVEDSFKLSTDYEALVKK